MKKLIIFDCDGTLVESEMIACEFFPKYWAKFGVEMTRDYFMENFIGKGHLDPLVIENYLKMPDFVKEEGDKLLEEEIIKSIQPVNGIEKLLEKLLTNKQKICVASNSKLDYVKNIIKKTRLNSFFGDKLFSSRQVINPKPSADLFLFVCESLGYEPKDCLVVEDSVSGIMAAKNANMEVIGFTGASHFTQALRNKVLETRPTYHCQNISELTEVMKV